MAEYGLYIGIAIVVLVTACAWWLGALANAGVKRFRSDQHESFNSQRKP